VNADTASPARAITKSIAIDRTRDDVFAFLADLSNWPRFAIVNVRSVTPCSDTDWWDMETPRGPGRLRIMPEHAAGILDHEFRNDEAQWRVPGRVVPNGRGAEFMMTFFQPASFADEFFDQQIALVDVELAKLKEILEQPL
jgi:uncharacterized membrane protein